MGAISQITDSISSALGTDGSGGGLLGGIKSLQSNPLVQTAEEAAAIYYGGDALGFWGDGSGSTFSSLFSSAPTDSTLQSTNGLMAADSNAASNAAASQSLAANAPISSATNSVLADSSAGTAGYGASSAAPVAPASPLYVNGPPDLSGGLPQAAAAQAPGLGAKLLSMAQTPKGALSLGTDLYSVYQGQQLNAAAQKYASAQDPMAPYRAQYAQQLAALNADPSKLTSLPGYQAGLEATQRSLAATGQTTSGAGLAQLAGYGQNFYQNQVNSLAGLATLGSAGGQAGASVLGAQSLANKADVSAGLNIASLFAQ